MGLDLLNSEVDRTAAVKEACWYCLYFLENAPRLLR